MFLPELLLGLTSFSILILTLVSLKNNVATINPVKGNKADMRILSRIEKFARNALIAGPNTNPKPKVAVILPKYFGLSDGKEQSATQVCITMKQ